MKKNIDIPERKPIWTALSSLYLDTELQWYEFRHIAKVIKESPYSLAEVKMMNSYEVFPILWTNMISVAGEWSGFDDEWVAQKIIDSLTKRNKLKDVWIGLLFKMYKSYFDRHWASVEEYMVDE